MSFSLLKFYLKYFVSLIAASPIEELERKGMSILVGWNKYCAKHKILLLC